MNNVLKSIKLDFMLIKEYFKIFIYILIISVFLSASSKFLIGGLVTSVSILAMRFTSLTFESEEKNNITNLYGILPISKKHHVVGRFIFTIIIGIATLMISLIIQSIILITMGVTITGTTCILGLILSMVVYLFTIALQLPGFYKYGAIKGRMFTLIPLAGFFIVYYLLGKLENWGISTTITFTNAIKDPTLTALIALIITIMISIISMIISVKIYEDKE
ncbi:ABC-2 transporter permease [Clostridium sp. MB40-C1]|uniref:ABC-2 transporter permease n=1 Tax=Clostridium sp. MB40-C1 TaxID=3070996 RepID=UPI0027E0DE68|nr:ABC-2 transporter permease [Clostridium sp. MB40-C1]WMJ79332.1 ABC-2 transporter permease [Clostridium sp. MB40-C1]